MKKTQLGPGSFVGGPTCGEAAGGREAAGLQRDLRPAHGEMDAEQRPAFMRLLRDAASFQQRMGKLRRSYSVAMPQPWRDGRSAGRTPTRVLRMKRRTSLQQAGALRPRCPAGKGLITPTAGRCCMRRAYHSATAAVPPWTAVGRAGLDPSGRSGSGTGPSRFLGRETLEKPDNGPSMPNNRATVQRSWASPPKVFNLVR